MHAAAAGLGLSHTLTFGEGEIAMHTNPATQLCCAPHDSPGCETVEGTH